MKAVIIAVALFLTACSEKAVNIVSQHKPLQSNSQLEITSQYQLRAQSVKEVWSEEKGTTVKRIAYLPDFNPNNANDWKALILYGQENINVDEQHTEILYFVLSEDALLPVNFSQFDESVNDSIFAQFNSWGASDALLFQVNIYSSFDDSFDQPYRIAQANIQNEFPGVFLY